MENLDKLKKTLLKGGKPRLKRVWRPYLQAITVAFLMLSGGYALTFITPWLWLLGGPIILWACMVLLLSFKHRWYRCLDCGVLIKRSRNEGEPQVCDKCGNEATLGIVPKRLLEAILKDNKK